MEHEEGQEEQGGSGKAVVTIKFLAEKDKLKKILKAVAEAEGEDEEEGLGHSGQQP